MITVTELLLERVEAEPDRTFIQELDGGTQTLQDFYTDTLRWADALASTGLSRGAAVATMLRNSARSFHSYLGASFAGGVEVPLNLELRGATLIHALNASRAETLVLESRHLEQVAEVADELTSLRRMILFGTDGTDGTDVRLSGLETVDGTALLAQATPRERPVPDATDPAAVIFTSGTTGPAKGVVKPWGDMLQFTRDWWHGEPSQPIEDGGYYQIWPTFHMSGKSALTFCLDAQLRMVIRERFSLSRFWDDIRVGRVSHCCFIFILPLLMRVPPRPDDADNPLEVAEICPLTGAYREFQERFGGRTVITGWGMTEAGQPIGTVEPTDAKSCGRPYPGTDVRLVDDDGRPVPDRIPGELLVRTTPTRANGYYLGLPEASAEAWRDGWMHTGDSFVRDGDGNYFFVDRKKDALRRRGHNISSMEVESELLVHPDVVECACIGVPWDFASTSGGGTSTLEDEEVKVYVCLAEGSTTTAADLIEFLRPRMPAFMLPRFVAFVQTLPKTPTGKLIKAELKTRLNTDSWDREAERRLEPSARTHETGVRPSVARPG